MNSDLLHKGGYADYYGATWDKIDKQDGVFWPCKDENDKGTPHMFLDKKFYHPDGKAKICAFLTVHRQKSQMKNIHCV